MFLLIAIIFSVYAKTKVFVILHSHNDAGWLNTVDDYYYNYTQHVISNMITFLQEYPSLRFSWAETMFLSKYLESHKSEIPIVKKLIESKRLEIVGGGWVQNDEALPDFELAIRQMETGFQYLKRELNITHLKTGWQLDPFGHSSLTAALIEKMGFETLVVSRVEENIRVGFI
jgi:alpha-mannosidase